MDANRVVILNSRELKLQQIVQLQDQLLQFTVVADGRTPAEHKRIIDKHWGVMVSSLPRSSLPEVTDEGA